MSGDTDIAMPPRKAEDTEQTLTILGPTTTMASAPRAQSGGPVAPEFTLGRRAPQTRAGPSHLPPWGVGRGGGVAVPASSSRRRTRGSGPTVRGRSTLPAPAVQGAPVGPPEPHHLPGTARSKAFSVFLHKQRLSSDSGECMTTQAQRPDEPSRAGPLA